MPVWLKEAKARRGGEGAFKSEAFVEKTLDNISSFMKVVFDGAEYAGKNGLLQSLEPKVRIIGIFFLVFAAALAGKALSLLAVIFFAIVLALLSGVEVLKLLKRVMPALIFTSIIISPVFFSFVTPGSAVLKAWGMAVTKEGLETGVFIIARVGVMAGFTALLLLTTGQSDLLKGMRGLVPAVFITALFMTFRYTLILLRTAEDSALARKSRTITGTNLRDSQGWFATRVGFILKKTVSTADEVTLAMVSRGFTGRMNSFEGRRLHGKDFMFIGLTSFALILSAGL